MMYAQWPLPAGNLGMPMEFRRQPYFGRSGHHAWTSG